MKHLETKNFKEKIKWYQRPEFFMCIPFTILYSVLIKTALFEALQQFQSAVPTIILIAFPILALVSYLLLERRMNKDLVEWGVSVSSHYIRYFPKNPIIDYREIPFSKIETIEKNYPAHLGRGALLIRFKDQSRSLAIAVPKRFLDQILNCLQERGVQVVDAQKWSMDMLLMPALAICFYIVIKHNAYTVWAFLALFICAAVLEKMKKNQPKGRSIYAVSNGMNWKKFMFSCFRGYVFLLPPIFIFSSSHADTFRHFSEVDRNVKAGHEYFVQGENQKALESFRQVLNASTKPTIVNNAAYSIVLVPGKTKEDLILAWSALQKVEDQISDWPLSKKQNVLDTMACIQFDLGEVDSAKQLAMMSGRSDHLKGFEASMPCSGEIKRGLASEESPMAALKAKSK